MLSFAKSFILFALFAYASATNVITSVTASTNLTPGQPFTITWTPDSSGTITLILRQGDASNLGTVGTIVANIPNTGSYTWYPENTLPGGTDYALEIVGTDGTPNYSHYFGINNPSVKAATTGSAATASGTSRSIPITTLPESLVTDSLISNSATTTNTAVLLVSGNSTFTSISSARSASGSSGSQSASASTASRSTTRSASQSIASATNAASSASSVVAEIVGGKALMTIIALTLSSMAFCMM